MKKTFIFLADGFEEIEAIAPIDILRRAEIDVITVSISNNKMVEGAHGVQVVADKLFSEVDFADNDMLILPGGGVGTENLGAHVELNQLLSKQFKEGKLLAAICAAPSVLGKIGILSGKEAICYPGFEDKLNGAIVSPKTVVKDGTVITGKGPGVAIPFALEIVKTLKGEETARQVADALIFN